MSSKREQSIADRRERILAAAREIIADKGYDGLTTRGLAEAAGVTVPTLYNLVGDKAAIISAMANQSVEQLWDRLKFDTRATPLEMADAIIDEAYDHIHEDPAFSRGTFIALRNLESGYSFNPDRDSPGAHAARRSVDMAKVACRAGQREGWLRGNLSARELAIQMFATYRASLDDWLDGAIDDGEMRRRQRCGFYMILAADASEEFRNKLMTRIAALAADQDEQEAA